jgi:DNA polymerase III subunit epsilon
MGNGAPTLPAQQKPLPSPFVTRCYASASGVNGSLRELKVLALDCQAAGATPVHGDMLEVGWAVCGASGIVGPVGSRWVLPRTGRRIGRAFRELTGWSEACLAEAVEEGAAWSELGEVVASLAAPGDGGVPTVIHFARFELPFLRDLHARLGPASDFPFDVVCVHAIASRLFPDLPRRNIRALAGYLGHSPELVRRSAGHVDATAFIWQALVPHLEKVHVSTWEELRQWLDERAPTRRSSRRSFPLAIERRRLLPDSSGVYRFLRRNGDVVYVGKAASLKKRVASHFKSRGPATERGLELLTQVHDIDHTETPSILEAALLECDEIKRLDPPYNVQLRSGERSAWFAARDLKSAVSAPDGAHRIGPVPSERALSPLSALAALVEGKEPSPGLRAAALAVPVGLVPDERLFREGFALFVADRIASHAPRAVERLTAASLALWLERGRTESDAGTEERVPNEWDLARVLRRLERNLVQTGLLLRRARVLCLLVDAAVAFRERDKAARGLVITGSHVVERHELSNVMDVYSLVKGRPRTFFERQRAFDSAAYDRLRTLLTELQRIRGDGGEIALAVGKHVFAGPRLAEALRRV